MKTLTALALAYRFACSATSIAFHASRRRRTIRHRRWGTRPINRKRDREGTYATLVKDMMQSDEGQFLKYTRMTIMQFKFLVKLVYPALRKSRILKISIPQRLAMTLHYLSEGCSMQEIAWDYRVGKATVHQIVKETFKVLWEKLQPTELPEPSLETFQETSDGFFKRWNLPNCIGALDGKHVNLVAPKKSGSVYFNYKKQFSIVLMASCDAYYRFTTVDIGGAGSNHDSAIFKSSGLGTALLGSTLEIPPPKALPNSNIVLPHFLVADAAFPLHNHIIRPYPGSFLGEQKNIFNYRISSARRCIENAFGILSQRWRILRRPINASLEVSKLIVQATVVLHNFLQNAEKDLSPSGRKYCPTSYVDSFDENGNLHEGKWREKKQSLNSLKKTASNNYTRRAKISRDLLCDYFNSDVGRVPWQELHVNRGGVPHQ